jgi:hypothetical protein
MLEKEKDRDKDKDKDKEKEKDKEKDKESFGEWELRVIDDNSVGNTEGNEMPDDNKHILKKWSHLSTSMKHLYGKNNHTYDRRKGSG